MKVLDKLNKRPKINLTLIIFAITVTLITTIIFVLGKDVFSYEYLSLLISLTIIIMVLIFNYRLNGVLQSILMLMTVGFIYVLAKEMEININWQVHSAVILSVGLMTFLLIKNNEWMRRSLKLGDSFTKTSKQSFKKTLFLNCDFIIVTSIPLGMFYLFGNDAMTHITSVVLIFMGLHFFINVLLKKIIVFYILAIHSGNQNKLYEFSNFNISSTNKETSFTKPFKWTIFFIALFIVCGFIGIIISSSLYDNTLNKINDDVVFSISKLLSNLFASAAIIFIYISFRYGIAFSLTFLSKQILLGLLFIAITFISKKPIDYTYSSIFAFMIGLSISLDLVSFQEINDKRKNHLGILNKDSIKELVNKEMRNNFKSILLSYLLTISISIIPIMFTKIVRMNADVIIILILLVVSNLFITPMLYVLFQTLIINFKSFRTRTGFWKNIGKEEQIVGGINNFED